MQKWKCLLAHFRNSHGFFPQKFTKKDNRKGGLNIKLLGIDNLAVVIRIREMWEHGCKCQFKDYP